MMKRLLVSLLAIVAGFAGAVPASASVPDWDLKGKPPVANSRDRIAPPPRPGASSAKALPPTSDIVRTYSGGRQGVTNTGITAGLKFVDNFRDTSAAGSDYTNLIEISAQDGNGNIVEVGWGKGLLSSCGTAACMFVYSWVNGVGQGFGVGYTDYAGSSFNPGDPMAGTSESAGCTNSAAARNARFGLRRSDTTNAWLVWADLCYGDATAGQWIGEFPQSNWTSQGASFLTSDFVQAFNETATQYTVGSTALDGFPCSDQGPTLATSTSGTGMRIADVQIQGVPTVNLTPFIVSSGNYIDSEMVGKYGAAALAGQPVGNVTYVNAGGPGFGPDGSGTPSGNTVGGINCT